MLKIISSFFVLLLGLSVGSFLNVCIYRLPRGQSIIHPASRCPLCGRALSPIDLIPLLGFLLTRGRCRYCGAPISLQYPIVELTTAILFLLIFLKYSITLEAVSFMVLVSLLLIAAFVDVNFMEIPDSVTIPGTIFGLILSGFRSGVPGSLFGAAFGFGFMFILARAAKLIFRREAMGSGDAMLSMMIGATLGLSGVLVSLFASALIGGIIGSGLLIFRLKKFGEEIPFGPMIAGGALLYIFFGSNMVSWYLSF